MTLDMKNSFSIPTVQSILRDRAQYFQIEHIHTCTSTNTILLERENIGLPSGYVLVTDDQTAGRGRLGRTWISSQCCSLTFSALWKFSDESRIFGLSLIVGLAVATGLQDLGINGISLKWPNDIWLNEKKVGGILIEVAFNSTGASTVIGIGINLHKNPDWQNMIDQPLAAIDDEKPGFSREEILAAILLRLEEKLEKFSSYGFESMRDEWDKFNALIGRWVNVASTTGDLTGLCIGCSRDGELEILDESNTKHIVTAGDVGLKVRPVPSPAQVITNPPKTK